MRRRPPLSGDSCYRIETAGNNRERQMRTEGERTRKRQAEGTLQVEVHVVGEHRLTVEEEDASRNVGNVNRERDDTVCVKSAESTWRSLGRCPPVLGMVALRGVLALSAPWASGRFSGQRPWTRRVLREPPCTPAPWATDGTRVAALTSWRALREHPALRSVCSPGSPVLETVPFRPEVSSRGVRIHPPHGVQRLKGYTAVQVPALCPSEGLPLGSSPLGCGKQLQRTAKLYREEWTASDVLHGKKAERAIAISPRPLEVRGPYILEEECGNEDHDLLYPKRCGPPSSTNDVWTSEVNIKRECNKQGRRTKSTREEDDPERFTKITPPRSQRSASMADAVSQSKNNRGQPCTCSRRP